MDAGNKVPADCILFEEMNITVDESIYGHTEKVSKNLSIDFQETQEDDSVNNHKFNPDPFLLVESKILTGQGKALVCAVGDQTRLARNRTQGNFSMIEGKETSLELKLKKISNFVENFAYGVIGIAVLTRSIFRFCMSSFAEGDLFTTQTLTYGAKIAIMAIVLLIVCIPEGLALAAQIAMALMIDQLKSDKILIKNHDAIQKAATITDICVSKTGVLTKGDGDVSKYHVAGEGDILENKPHLNESDCFKNAELERKEEMVECILMNSDVTFQAEEPAEGDKDPEYTYKPRGPAIEVAAMNFLNGCDPEHDVHEMLDNLRTEKVRLFTFPFDQSLKRKMTVYALSHEEARVVVKGSPESIGEISGEDLSQIATEMAQTGLKLISYATRVIKMDEVRDIQQ